MKRYKVNVGKRNHYFADLAAARAACSEVFNKTGVVLAIEDVAMTRARKAIERRATVCFDVAAECGQMFDNIKHMSWFVAAVADELAGVHV